MKKIKLLLFALTVLLLASTSVLAETRWTAIEPVKQTTSDGIDIEYQTKVEFKYDCWEQRGELICDPTSRVGVDITVDVTVTTAGGTTEDNFKVVSDEFGEDFQEFIMDKSPIKIYVGEKNDGMATVKFYNKYINLTNNNFIMNFIKDLATYTNKAYINIRDKISGITKNNKENSNYKESDFDKNINEFIKNNSK